jgi:hypothetical protein
MVSCDLLEKKKTRVNLRNEQATFVDFGYPV